jgi:5'-3' exonuclease
MGVPGLYGIVIRRYFNTILLHTLPSDVTIDDLLLDLNAMFHDAAAEVLMYGDVRKTLERQGAQGRDRIDAIEARNAELSDEELEKAIFDQIGANILEAVTDVRPTQRLIMAVDGLAPVAKLNQQRGRRKKSAMNKTDGEFESEGQRRFDATTSFTPATEVMFRLNSYLMNFIQKNRYQLAPKIVYFNHLTRGEGEHKLMTYLRESIPANDKCVIMGADADLIMLTLRVYQHVYIVRKNLRPETRWDPELRKRVPESKVMDINLLKKALENANVQADDFIFAMFLYGNDFIPSQPGINDIGESFPEIWVRLQNHKLFENGELILENWRDFLTTLTATQYRFVKDLATKPLEYPFILAKESFTDEDTFDEANFRGLWISRMFFAEQVPYTDDQLLEAVQWSADEYLQTLLWINQYYKDHLTPDWNYAYPRLFTPLIEDALLFSNEVTPPVVTPYRLNPLGQLMAVMPIEVKDKLPEAVQIAYRFDSPIADMYPKRIGELIEGKTKNMKHVSTLWIPPIDINRVIEVQERLPLTKAKLGAYAPDSVYEVVHIAQGVKAPPILPQAPKPNLVSKKPEEVKYPFTSNENLAELSKLYGYDTVRIMFAAKKHRFFPDIHILSSASIVSPEEGRELITFPTVEVVQRQLK